MFDTDPDPDPDVDPDRPRLGYYLAVAVFLATLAFAVLGLVRVSSMTGSPSSDPESASRPVATRTPSAGRVPTAQIPPPTRSAPTRPPSVTYLYPPPEESVTAGPAVEDQPRR